jgi:hypothetical protein
MMKSKPPESADCEEGADGAADRRAHESALKAAGVAVGPVAAEGLPGQGGGGDDAASGVGGGAEAAAKEATEKGREKLAEREMRKSIRKSKRAAGGGGVTEV